METLLNSNITNIIKLSTKQRVVNTFKTSGVFLSLAIASIAVPLLHFILVPLFIGMALYFGIKTYECDILISVHQNCQSCEKPLDSNYLSNNQNYVFRCKNCLAKNEVKK